MKNTIIIFLVLCSISGFSQVPITRSLPNVNNTADSLKPVSNAQATINTSLQSSITTNTANIATNTGNISTNTSNITANSTAISTNTSNIATNTANIATNTANVATNATAITTKLNKAGDVITGDLDNTTTGFFRVANGTTAQRPVSPLNGMLRYNTDVLRNEFYSNGAWRTHARLEGDTFTGNISATNLSGTNSGDETTGTIQTKLGTATSLISGYLTSTDWNTFNNKQTLLGFTPYNATNPSGFISAVPAQTFFSLTGKPTTLGGYGITDSYPLTGNPSAFLTSINSTNVTTALGFTPYNSTNPNGFITSSSLSSYLPITGGTLTGTGGSGFVSFPTQSAIPATPTNGFSLFANSTNALSWKGANGFVRTFDGTANTADRTYVLPNLSGTIPLLEANQIWTGNVNSFINTLLIGTSTNSGYKLDVIGTSRVLGDMTISSGTNTGSSTTGALTVAGSVGIGGFLNLARGAYIAGGWEGSGSNYSRGLVLITQNSGVGSVNAIEGAIMGITTANGNYTTSDVRLLNLGIGISKGAGHTITNAAGVVIPNISQGANNSNLILGQGSTPTGNYSIYNSSTYQNYFAGNVGIGTTAPTSKIQVVGIQAYADNATAIAAGLTAGAFYRTATGVLMVVF